VTRTTLVLAGLAAGSGLALAACIVDLSNLSGGTRDGGATGGGMSSSVTTSSTSGSGGAPNPGCTGAVLDCSGCACPQGGCDAVPLATGNDAGGPLGIATSSDGLFWVDKAGGRIMGILAQGSAPQLLTEVVAPAEIAAASGRLVFTAQDGLWTCLLPSCDATRKHYASPIAPGGLQSVAYDGSLIYWSDRGDNVTTGNGKVWRCDPKDSCASPYLIADLQLLPQGLFLTTDSLFWIAQGNGQSNGSIHKSPRTGAGQTDLAAALVLPTGLAADDTYVYWTQATMSGKVLRCNHTMGYCTTPSDVAPKAGALGLPRDLAIAGARVYWSENSNGTISSCPLPGCSATEQPRVHASGRTGVHRLAVGSSCLFWADDVNGGTIDKMGR
jgi:hypothetical protein